jgi:MFS family permease
MASLAETAHIYHAAGRNSALRRALIAFLLFNAQEYAIWIAIALYAFERGGTTTAGIVVTAQLVPAAIVAPFGSVIGDRMRRDRALALGYTVQASGDAACALALWFAPPLVVYAAAVCSACAITLTRPVHNAILPDLAASPEELTASNSVSATAEGVGIMLGPIVNSVLIGHGGPALVCAVFAGVMALSAFMASTLRLHAVPRTPHEDVRVEGLFHAASEGFRELRGDHAAAALTALGGAQFLLLGMLDVFYPLLAVAVLAIGTEGAGLLAAAVGLGGLVGAAATAVLVGRRRMASPIESALGITAAAFAGISLAVGLGPVLALLSFVGAARSFFDVAARTLLQRSVSERILARVFGLQEALAMGATAVGAASVPILVAAFGHRLAFAAAGAVVVVLGLAALPSLWILDRRAVLPDPERFAIVRAIPMFSVLSQPALERLLAALIPLDLAVGETLIREGDPGERFYLILAGEAEVSTGGRPVARLGRGDYVGEIALLRDVPRSATVRAVTDLELAALEREDFLSAVTGWGAGHRAAVDAEVDRRLGGLERDDPH